MTLGDPRRSSVSRLASAAASVIVLALVVVVGAIPAAATVFQNGGSISIPSQGKASPYPSTIAVSGLSGSIKDVNASLVGLGHSYPDDVDVLLVGPAGQKVVLMADVGGGNTISGVDLTFDDSAGSSLPDNGTITSGTYKPTIGATTGGGTSGFDGTSPAPSGPYATALGAFKGTAPNGTWKLFVFDDGTGDSGSISHGWSLDITAGSGPTITSFSPTSGGVGTSVTITGTNLTGATSVKFGGVSATSFTVNSGTKITATVPSGAVTGPISVTTPSGTATSSAKFTVIAAPTIGSFSPGSGKVGDLVVIIGANLTGATSVKFNGTSATSFAVNSSTQITATVPAGATAGFVTVTTPGGTGSSSTRFVVEHLRTVTLGIGRKAHGFVTVADGFTACASGVPVKVQHRDNGRWKVVAIVVTGLGGSYTAGGVGDPGRYRSVAAPHRLASGDKCVRDVSPVVRK